MQQIIKFLRAPGARREIESVAPTQVVPLADLNREKDVDLSIENQNFYTVAVKSRTLDRWLDIVVAASGSEFVYFSIILALIVWAFLGIQFGTSNTWQVTISDAQAIVNMVFDAFLMRQQLNSHESLVTAAACLRSRSVSNKRMLQQLVGSYKCNKVEPTQVHISKQTDFATRLPTENLLGRISTKLSTFMGHIITVFGFWVCIFMWIGFGKYCNWSNTWQLYINSATSALMVFILAFLANIRERHTKYTTKCLESIWEVDAALELRLRTATGDTVENAPVAIPARKRSRLQRAIDYYADLVGTLVGIVILIFVLVVWVAIGPALHFNTDWWLLIGTYAGLIGLNDGFVLRNVFTVLGEYENAQFSQVESEDTEMLAEIGMERLEEELVADNSLTCRVSLRVGDICSHEWTVVFGVILIIGMIIGASAMGWNVTGQLLCNVPPSIIESFFTLILITGHNIGDAKRRVDLHNVYLRRLQIVSYIELVTKTGTPKRLDQQSQVDETIELEE